MCWPWMGAWGGGSLSLAGGLSLPPLREVCACSWQHLPLRTPTLAAPHFHLFCQYPVLYIAAISNCTIKDFMLETLKLKRSMCKESQRI